MPDTTLERYALTSAYINNQTDEAWERLQRAIVPAVFNVSLGEEDYDGCAWIRGVARTFVSYEAARAWVEEIAAEAREDIIEERRADEAIADDAPDPDVTDNVSWEDSSRLSIYGGNPDVLGGLVLRRQYDIEYAPLYTSERTR